MMMRAVPLAVSAVSRDMRGIYRRAKRNTALMVVSGICFATAYVAGLIAAGAFLAPIYGPALSALLIAAAMAVIGLVVLAVLSLLKLRDKRRNARRRAGQNLAAAAAISILPQLTGSKSLLALAAIGGLAFLAARSQGGEEDV
ncbi:hypothetical protein [Roseibium sediminicola]|uniref:Holin-X, holin superfamily III n=1 Tax=Roseibium sediminicola TaxID=2933272 RepID=A0ABT0H096_9HYPH|nr:hypothetical protein [Roseibium sp. CAU 1639]MCK7615106.1 hypothetical protein [Roseibium sp. CAU 1639]